MAGLQWERCEYEPIKANATLVEHVTVEDADVNQISLMQNRNQDFTNMLIESDNLLAAQVLQENYKGLVSLIYCDPPFYSQQEFGDKSRPGYSDLWHCLDDYLNAINNVLIAAKTLLKSDGSIFVHSDWHCTHYIRLLMDEVFGASSFCNEIVWHYYNKLPNSRTKFFARTTDTILFFSASQSTTRTFHTQYEDRPNPIRQLRMKQQGGKIINVKDESGKNIYDDRSIRQIDNVWRIPMLQPAGRQEFMSYQTQKPLDLLLRIISCSTNESEIVADLFCGSGTAAVASGQLGRKWIAIDKSAEAIQISKTRLKSLIVSQYHKSLTYRDFDVVKISA